MNPDQSPQLSPEMMQRQNPLNAMRQGEVAVFSIRRHPIGMFTVYASFILLLIIVAGVVIAAPSILSDTSSTVDTGTVRMVGWLVFLVAAVFAGLFSLVARIVYFGNRWILTTDSITQVSQTSLFNKQNSQLSLGNLEDVTVVQDGILTHMFNFGILKCETAGERSKFSFYYCPNPNYYAQQILVARENFEQGKLYSEQRPDHTQGVDTNVAPPPTVTTPGEPTTGV